MESVNNEIKVNMEYYKQWQDEGTDLIEELKQYTETGIRLKSFTNVLLTALSNVYMLTIMLLTSNDEFGYYFLAREQHCIFPLKCKQYKMTVMMNIEKHQYHALLHIQGSVVVQIKIIFLTFRVSIMCD